MKALNLSQVSHLGLRNQASDPLGTVKILSKKLEMLPKTLNVHLGQCSISSS